MAAHQFFGVQITLVANTATNVLNALRLIDATIPPSVRELTVEADSSVPGTLLLGDAAISTSRYGKSLIAAAGSPVVHDSIQWGQGSPVQGVLLGSLYVLSTAAMKVNVLGMV